MPDQTPRAWYLDEAAGDGVHLVRDAADDRVVALFTSTEDARAALVGIGPATELLEQVAELQFQRRRVGDLLAEIMRQLKPLARHAIAGNAEAHAELVALIDRCKVIAMDYAAGREWSRG